MTLRLRVTVPTEAVVDCPAAKITVQAVDGSFCLLPRHVDFVTALVPGVLTYVDPEGREAFVALDAGILVKCGSDVLVSTPRAVAGADLGQLRTAVEEQFRHLDEREAATRTALRKLEASFLRGLLQLEEVAGG